MSGIEIAWAATSTIVAIAIGVAVSIIMGGPSEGEAWLARLLLVGSAVVLCGVTIGWLLITARPMWWRRAVGASVGAIAVALTPEALRHLPLSRA